jgi:hypothetical protein
MDVMDVMVLLHGLPRQKGGRHVYLKLIPDAKHIAEVTSD